MGKGYISFVLLLPVSVLAHPAFADTAGVSNIEDFIKSIITVLTACAGLIAAGFFVYGGIRYITSSGDPNRLQRAKNTILYAAVGLSITFASYVLTDIITTLATKAFGS